MWSMNRFDIRKYEQLFIPQQPVRPNGGISVLCKINILAYDLIYCRKITDLAQIIISIPPGIVRADHVSPAIDGTEPHLSVAMNCRKQRRVTV